MLTAVLVNGVALVALSRALVIRTGDILNGLGRGGGKAVLL